MTGLSMSKVHASHSDDFLIYLVLTGFLSNLGGKQLTSMALFINHANSSGIAFNIYHSFSDTLFVN